MSSSHSAACAVLKKHASISEVNIYRPEMHLLDFIFGFVVVIPIFRNRALKESWVDHTLARNAALSNTHTPERNMVKERMVGLYAAVTLSSFSTIVFLIDAVCAYLMRFVAPCSERGPVYLSNRSSTDRTFLKIVLFDDLWLCLLLCLLLLLLLLKLLHVAVHHAGSAF